MLFRSRLSQADPLNTNLTITVTPPDREPPPSLSPSTSSLHEDSSDSEGDTAIVSVNTAKDKMVRTSFSIEQTASLFDILNQPGFDVKSLKGIETGLSTGQYYVNEVDPKSGQLPLHFAARRGHILLVGLLIRWGGLTSVPDLQGQLPKDLAKKGPVKQTLTNKFQKEEQLKSAAFGLDANGVSRPLQIGRAHV